MSLEHLKREVALLTSREQADLISYAIKLRYDNDAIYLQEVTDRLNDSEQTHWLTPKEVEHRLDQA